MKVYQSPELELRKFQLLSILTASDGEGDPSDWETEVVADGDDSTEQEDQ